MEACVGLARTLDDQVMLAMVLGFFGGHLDGTGSELDAGLPFLEESRSILERCGEDSEFARGGLAMTMRNLGMAARRRRQYERSADFFRAAISAARSLGPARGYALARGLADLGRTKYLQGDTGEALSMFLEALEQIKAEHIGGHVLADCLDWLAATLGSRGNTVSAARLFGAA
jgi:tetratricopeptide (TPR) repeat protein